MASHQSMKIRKALVDSAILVVREKFPEKTEGEYQLAESRLKTSIKCLRRGNERHYTLSVPELNLMFHRVEYLK